MRVGRGSDEREVDVGEVGEAFPEFGEGACWEVADLFCGPAGVLGDECALELSLGGSSLLSAAAFDFAA